MEFGTKSISSLEFSSCISLLLNFGAGFLLILSETHCALVKDGGEMALLSFDRETEKFSSLKAYS